MPSRKMLLNVTSYRRYDVLALCLIVILLWQISCFLPSSRTYGSSPLNYLSTYTSHSGSDNLDAANSTLGFQMLIALSSENRSDIHAWRADGLIKAANRTGLNVQIWAQTDANIEEIKELRDDATAINDEQPKKEEQLSKGQILARLAHTQAMQSIIDTNITTALIMEDDADWDVNVRSSTSPIAAAVRALTRFSSPAAHPYGTDWDVLWLGHCGSLYDSSPASNIQFRDPNVLPTKLLRSIWIGVPYDFPNHIRNVHISQGPMCSFGYAVTLDGAKKVKALVSMIGDPFDVQLHHACRDGVLKCISVAPEIIHHQRRMGSSSLSDDFLAGMSEQKAGAKPTEEVISSADVMFKGHRVFTHNIMHSARCNWNRRDSDLVQCLPSVEEWDKYPT